MTAPTLRVIHPDDDGGPEFLEPPAQPAATASAAPPVTGPDVPPIDYAGTVRLRRTWQQVAATVAPVFVPPGAAATAWLTTGDPTVMMGVGCAGGVAVMAWDRRRTRENRWSTTARPPQGGRRRTDAERARDMAATTAPAGTVHR